MLVLYVHVYSVLTIDDWGSALESDSSQRPPKQLTELLSDSCTYYCRGARDDDEDV
jgi:hypothetical protein